MPDPANGRVTNAILATKLDYLIQAQLLTNAHVEEHNRAIAELKQCDAVNCERWDNHRGVHQRERGALGALSAGLSTIAAVVAVWFEK